jgi:hypothetical protein
MQCGIKEKGKPECAQELVKIKGRKGLYCTVHCRAKTERGPCKRHHKKDGLRCHKHGGNSVKGLEHHKFKDGTHARRYEGVLDPDLLAIFQQRKEDTELLSLRPDISLLDMRVEILHARSKIGAGIATVASALEACEEFIAAQAAKDRDKAIEALQRLLSILRKGVSEDKDWEKIEELAWTKRARLVEAESKRLVAQSKVDLQEQVMRFVQLLAASIERNVTDPESKQRVKTDLRRLAGGNVIDISARRTDG